MLKTTGVTLSDDQIYLLEARLSGVAKGHRFASIGEYVAAARESTDVLGQSLIDAMTTHETFFFRDGPFWKAFEETVMPLLLAQKPKSLKIWSAACSYGQEPYSLAMLLEERWPDLAQRTTIHATDISAPAIEKARRGIFVPLEVNRGLPAAKLIRHFDQVPGGFQVKAHLRERLSFRVGNLLTDRAESGLDLVLCRNVLIYFGDSDRRKVLHNLTSALRPGGFLAVGASETIPNAKLAPGWYAIDEKRTEKERA